MAQRLRAAVRDGDTVARLGGDEFTVLCPGVRDADSLLRDADTAMYQAKGAGKDRVEVFSEETRRRIVRRLELEQRLRAALEQETLAVHYQPQVDLATGRMVGVEALARWDEAAPAEFIGLAEETGLIAPLGAWVLRTACRALAGWHAAGLEPLTVTVNVSTRQLEDPDFPAIVQDLLAGAGIPASALCLELTESALMDAGEASVDVLREIKDLGIYVGIDDFGTGHPSLARLRRLPVEVLEVDRSFVDGLGTEREDSAVVAAILSLAHALGLHVVAEGVETPLQADQLTALGCPVAQGYLWSPAVPAARVPELAAGGTVAPAAAGRVPRGAQPRRRDAAPDRLRQGVPRMNVAAGLLSVALGLAYTGLGWITALELVRHSAAAIAPNVVLFANYMLVGFFTARTQFARRPVLGGWSLSGVAMAGVFTTCGVTHLVAGLTTRPDIQTLTLPNLGVPASIFFLYVVHRLHRRSLRDWNRAPLVGRAAPLGRRSPWAEGA